jgi:hypothetical protein
VIWAIDTTSNPTVYHLLEQVNDTIPIESDGQWGLDDYAVEVKGSTGANYECLHFQHLASVIKDEDEVMFVSHSASTFGVVHSWSMDSPFLEYALSSAKISRSVEFLDACRYLQMVGILLTAFHGADHY